MGDVVSLHAYLVAPVRNCFTCPMAFLESVSPFGDGARYECTADRERGAIDRNPGAVEPPDWCTLRRQPVLVKLALPEPPR